MTRAAHANPPAAGTGSAPRPRTAVGRMAGILRRIVDAISESHERQSERDVARFIARRGGRITDDLEREIGHPPVDVELGRARVRGPRQQDSFDPPR